MSDDADSTPPDGALPAEGASDGAVAPMTARQRAVVVVAVFAAGLCSIIYELLIGTASSYFLGDSITQFSITIGVFMAAMGLGAYLSRRFTDRVLERFVTVELALGLLGGLSVPALYFAFAYTELYEPIMMLLIVLVGALTGLEVPMLVMVMRRQQSLEENVSNVLSLDYLGALGATLLFPFALLPLLGTFRSSLATGLLNVAVAVLVLRTFSVRVEAAAQRRLQRWAGAGAALLVALFVFSPQLLRPWHGAIYEDRVVHVEQSRYQKIILTKSKDDLRMFLNGNLQFSALDEYRYHEALVHPAMSAAKRPPRRILLLGGGDGLAIRELLAHPSVEEVVMVDLDPAVTQLAREHAVLRRLNGDSLRDPRVKVHHQDAFVFLKDERALWDVIIADLPDPNNAGLARLYSREFYGLVRNRLAAGGVVVTQATSPFFAKDAFWCIEETMRRADLETRPYHAYVPAFGDWGFVLAAPFPIDVDALDVTVPTRFLDRDVMRSMFVFEKDLRPTQRVGSSLDEPVVLSRYLAGWQHWN